MKTIKTKRITGFFSSGTECSDHSLKKNQKKFVSFCFTNKHRFFVCCDLITILMRRKFVNKA